jgi:hypothetical protein
MRSGIALSLLIAVGACTGNISGDDDDDGTGGPVTIAFTSPAPGSMHARDRVEPSIGWRAAEVAVDLAIEGSPATIELPELNLWQQQRARRKDQSCRHPPQRR